MKGGVFLMAKNGPNYQAVSEDRDKACINCKHFKPAEGEKGDCMGYEVSAVGTCNYFEAKEE